MKNIATHRLEQLESRQLLSAGELDPGFSGGKLFHDLMGGDDFAFAMAIQSDGKILLAGRSHSDAPGAGNDFAVARFNADGTLDNSFGSGGVVTTDLGTTSDTAYAIAIQSDGKILLAGDRGSGAAANFAVVRYNADGSLDNSFGSSGVAMTDIAGNTDAARAMTLMSDGRIVVAGSALVGGRTQMAVARYTTSGALDTTFDVDGKTTTSFSAGVSDASGVVVLPDGSIVVGGSAMTLLNGNRDFGAVKYHADGSLDTTFGSGGWSVFDMGGDSDSTHALALRADGKILLVGDNFDSNSGLSDFAIARLNANGSLDGAFGSAGRVLTDFNGEIDEAMSIALQADGHFIVAGFAQLDGMSSFAVARYEAGGSLDANFAGGKLMVAFDSESVANAVAVDASGKIVLGGFTANELGDEDFALARLQVQSNLAPIAKPGGPYSVSFGGSIMLSGLDSIDPDGSIASYEWDFNYDGHTFTTDATGSTANFSAAGMIAQTRMIALRVTDSDGATHVATATLTINPAPLPPPPPPPPSMVVLKDDPAHAGKKILVFTGTDASERVRFSSVKGGRIEVRYNNKSLGTFANVSKIIAAGNGGNDELDAFCAGVAVEFCGGAGNDRLIGSRFSDILLGGDGNDQILGWQGNDLIVGGAGKDDLWSKYGDDMLVGGNLSCENNPDALRVILKTMKLGTNTVVDDKAVDLLHGTPLIDVLMSGTGDKIDKIRHCK